jgi:hypothetical protein
MKHTSRFGLVAVLLSASACGQAPLPLQEHRGVSGNAVFAFTESRGCAPTLSLFSRGAPGCAIDRPMLAGVRETLVVQVDANSDEAGVTLRARDTNVVSLDATVDRTIAEGFSTYRVRVTAGARAGATWFDVLDARGATIDSRRVEVAEARTIVFRADNDTQPTLAIEGDGDRVRVPLGQRGSVTAWVRDAAGRELIANDAVHWSVDTADVVRLSWWTMGPTAVSDDRVYLEGVAPGEKFVSAQAGSVRRTLRVTVAP